MREEKRPTIKTHRGLLDQFGCFRPPNRVRHAAGKKNASGKLKNRLVGAKRWPNYVFVVPNRSCRKRHWFPADGISCLPVWSGRFFQRSFLLFSRKTDIWKRCASNFSWRIRQLSAPGGFSGPSYGRCTCSEKDKWGRDKWARQKEPKM